MRISAYVPSEEIFNTEFAGIKSNNIVEKSEGISFGEVLKNSLDGINDKQLEADSLTEGFIKGDENIDIADVMLSSAEASMSLQYAVQVRNKLVDAYQEIIKMQI